MGESLKMLPLNKTCDVNFNWSSSIPGRTVRDTIVISYAKEDDVIIEEDINEIIDVDRTVDFEPSKCLDKPRLTFTLPAVERFYVDRLYIVCDCKIIEVYGDHDIYIDTVHGNIVEECENFRACEFRISMGTKVQKQISINFLKLNSESRLWIYGLRFLLKPLRQNQSGSIKYENVEDLIKGAPISDKASRCFNFLKESMMNQQFNRAQLPFPSSMNNTSVDNSDKLVQEMKQYIDHKFQVLTEFLILRERNLQDKVDLILDYIKSSKQ